MNAESVSEEVADRCKYLVKRKKRYCRMTVKKGEEYCGEHRQESANHDVNEKNNNQRIKCPLDSTHTCYLSKLPKHLKICNAKRLLDAQPAFVVKGINVEEVSEIPKRMPLSRLDDSLVNAVINKVNVAYESLPEFSEKILKHAGLANMVEDEFCGKAAKKHLLQNASLLAHLEHASLVQDNTCYIEFGAGKGKLAYWLAQIIKDKQNSCILLIDRSSHRHKRDNKLRNQENSLTIKRVRADIADLLLNDIPGIKDIKYKVGIAKHLCGAATDLAIRCLYQARHDDSSTESVKGLVIAFCCHHRCDYASYVGKQYLKKCNFTADEFPILCSIASWATCGSGLSRAKKALKQQKHDDTAKTDDGNQNYRESEREIIGRKVKALLNWGRLEFLKSAGFQSDLYYYISTEVSLENMCIVATRSDI